MKKLSNRQLKMLRNIICAMGIAIGFLLWLFLPMTFKNSALFHVGNGKYGNKIGALIILPMQFFAFIPNKEAEEIHTEYPKEREEIREQKTHEILEKQVAVAFYLAAVIWIVMGLAVLIL